MNPDLMAYLNERRSAPILEAPGPGRAQIQEIVTCACSVPDHRRLVPWRVIAVENSSRELLGELWARHLAESVNEAASLMRNVRRAPVILVCVFSPKQQVKVPRDEQLITAGLASYTILMAANALGFGGYWRTGRAAYNRPLAEELGLEEHESIAGYLYLGTVAEPLTPRPRPTVDKLPLDFAFQASALECN